MLFSKYLALPALISAWTLEKGGVTVTGHGDVGERESFSSLSGPVELYEGTTLDLAFTIDGTPLPHQVFVRISADADYDEGVAPVDKIVPAKMRGKTAKVSVPFKALPSNLYNYNLEVAALLSSLKGEFLEEKLFDLVAFGEDDSQESLNRLAGSGASLISKPEIFHQFQSKPKHVKAMFALAFVVVIDTLAFLLVQAWSTIFASSKRTSSTNLKYENLRLGSVVFIEFSFVLYFLSFSIFDLMKLAVLPFALFLVFSDRLQKAE